MERRVRVDARRRVAPERGAPQRGRGAGDGFTKHACPNANSPGSNDVLNDHTCLTDTLRDVLDLLRGRVGGRQWESLGQRVAPALCAWY
jgi:hypothetical protein